MLNRTMSTNIKGVLVLYVVLAVRSDTGEIQKGTGFESIAVSFTTSYGFQSIS